MVGTRGPARALLLSCDVMISRRYHGNSSHGTAPRDFSTVWGVWRGPRQMEVGKLCPQFSRRCPKDISETRPSGSADSSQIQLTPLTVFFLPRKNKKKDKTMGSDSGVRVEGNLSADDATQGGRTHVTPVWWQELAPTRRSRCLAPRFPFPALGALPRLRQDAAPQAEPVPVMATAGPDLYERLQIRYPPSPPARAPAPAAHPAASGWALGTTLAVATGVLLVLGAALVALIVLHVQGQAELRAAQAELAAVGAPLLPDPDGSRGPAKSPAAVQRQKEQLGRWLQELALGWRYHDGQIYYFSGERKTWGEAEAACRSSHSHLASITSPEEQDYLAREARGRPYWIGLTATGPGGSWRWVDGAAYSQAQSFWAPGQPDSTDHGKWGLEGCAQIHPVGNGLWNDHNCNFTFAWICKRGLSRP